MSFIGYMELNLSYRPITTSTPTRKPEPQGTVRDRKAHANSSIGLDIMENSQS